MASDYRIGQRVRITAYSAMRGREGTLLYRMDGKVWAVHFDGERPMAFREWEMEVICD
jgi:hypothetical protein